MKDKVIAVICRDIETFQAIRKTIDPSRKRRWTYITTPQDMRGMNGSTTELWIVDKAYNWELYEELTIRFSSPRHLTEEILFGR